MAFFLVPKDSSPWIDSCLNLATKPTIPRACPQLQNNFSKTAIFFSDCRKSQKWSWNLIRMSRWCLMAILCSLYVLYLFCCSKLKLSSTILMVNVARLARFIIFYSRLLFSTIYVFIPICIIYDWITIMEYSKHELGTINMIYPPKEIVLFHSFLPIKATSPQKATLPQGGRCGEDWLHY